MNLNLSAKQGGKHTIVPKLFFLLMCGWNQTESFTFGLLPL